MSGDAPSRRNGDERRARWRPSRALGQNFLHDQEVAREIVDLFDPKPGEPVVEIGPGRRALTGFLADRATQLVLVEKDDVLAEALAEEYAGRDGIKLIHADAADLDVRELYPLGPVRAIGNLPFSAGGAILSNFLDDPSPVHDALFMVQEEVADRICAIPRTKAYGILSLILQAFWTPRVVLRVPPEAFKPAPRVRAGVVRFERRPPGSLPACDSRLFSRLVRHGFSQRRKQIKKLLPLEEFEWEWPDLAAALSFPATVRAEELSLDDWVRLTNFLDPHASIHPAQRPDERFVVVDKFDRAIGESTRGEVHRRNMFHRAVHVFIFNRNGDLFLQKRSHLKDVHPGRWDSSAAGHLDIGEEYEAAAVRELREELGIRADLEPVGKLAPCEETGWEFVCLYAADSPESPHLAHSEIETGEYFPVDLLERWIEGRPDDFASGFIECLKLYQRRMDE